ncbi:hypothetical protein ACJJTC_013909 [Scirpophaga incertulas]
MYLCDVSCCNAFYHDADWLSPIAPERSVRGNSTVYRLTTGVVLNSRLIREDEPHRSTERFPADFTILRSLQTLFRARTRGRHPLKLTGTIGYGFNPVTDRSV